MAVRTVGVEEEFLLVDPDSGRARACSAAVLRFSEGAVVTGSAELQREQIEIETRPCSSLAELAGEIGRQRRSVVEVAQRAGVEVVSLASSPLPADPSLSPGARYEWMGERFGVTAHEALTGGCHVHVEVDSDDEGVAVLNRIRPWLPSLLAISANSPFWQGEDTGYASFRSQAWTRWPSAGPTGDFESAQDYHTLVSEMLDCGVLLDEKMVYFDARLSQAYPTVEVRVADVCLRGDDAVLVAALTRALVETAAREWRCGGSYRPTRIEVMRLAMWRASRSGHSAELLDPRSGRPSPAEEVLAALIEHTRSALSDAGELELVAHWLCEVLSRGCGAAEQREIESSSGRLEAVVKAAASAMVADLQPWSVSNGR
ncbi:MAG: glutamate--cysteine ligase [Actinomycetota bacterium]|nr:glutamate--cysteine ligase [Actinomycetota bacterium]